MNHSFAFLSYKINPFVDNHNFNSFLIEMNGNTFTDLHILKTFTGTLVTYDVFLIIHLLKEKKIGLNFNIIDLSLMYKCSLFRHKKDNTIIFIIKLLKTKDPQLSEQFIKIFLEGKWNIDIDLKKVIFYLKQIYNELTIELQKVDEYNRYLFEEKINKVLLDCQYRGIRINQKKLIETLDKIDKKIFKAQRELRKNYEITDFNKLTILKEGLLKNGYKNIAEISNKDDFEKALHTYSPKSELLNNMNIYLKNNKDRKFIYLMGAIKEKRVYPFYNCIGTLSSRILLNYPYLQYVSKENRKIIQADVGKKLLYIDYSQFEPGILAHFSNDHNFINDYNKGDIYSELSMHLFNTNEERKIAKIIFLSFMYGAKKKNIIKILNEVGLTVDNETFDGFFNRYSTLKTWKEKLISESLKIGKVASVQGNYRYTNNKKTNWILSHFIQSTASYILKKAILKVNQNCSEVDFILPMHDAVLWQVPRIEYNKYRYRIQEIFLNEFALICSSIKPHVTFPEF